jgi:signal transduction histidine kinase
MFEALRWRLTAWYVGVFCVAFIAVGCIVFVWADRRLTHEVDRAVREVSDGASAQAAQHARIIDAEEETRGLLSAGKLSSSADVFVLLLDPDGTVVSNPGPVPLDGLPAAASVEAAAAHGEDMRSYSAAGKHLEIRTLEVRGPDGTVIGFVQAGKSVEERDDSLRTLAIVMAGGAVGGLVLATLGGLFVAAIAIRPVKRSFERQREFVADASHELRTPLAVIRVNAESIARTGDDEAISDIAHEATYMTRLLDDLLVLARSDREGIDLQVSRIDLADVAQSAGRGIARLAESRGLIVAVDAPSPLWVEADPERCREVLLILLDNAIKYTPAGGSITLRAAAAADEAIVSVTDTGIGVAPEDVGRLFDRFYRVDKARSRAAGGTGLGLSIAREIMDAHGGTLQIESVPGSGTTVTMRLRLARAAADRVPGTSNSGAD